MHEHDHQLPIPPPVKLVPIEHLSLAQLQALIAKEPVSDIVLTQEVVGDQATLHPFHRDLHDRIDSQIIETATAGLTAKDWKEIQRCVVRAAYAGLKREPIVHYTEQSLRWSGIAWARRGIAYRSWQPWFADCSAFVTWCWWDGTRWKKLLDLINGAGWASGYTGTMVQHGRMVTSSEVRPADTANLGSLIVPYHTLLCVGNGLGISHGRESAPELVSLAQQPITSYRTYLP